MRQMIFLIEIISVLLCIHYVYGEKIHINRWLVVTVLSLLLNLNVTNEYALAVEGSLLLYMILLLYCVKIFNRGIKETLINIVLFMIVITVTQFVCSLPIVYVIKDNLLLRALCADILTLIASLFIVPKFELSKVAKWALKRNGIFYVSIAYLFFYVCVLLTQMKVNGSADIELFIFLAPFVVCVFLIYKEWARYYTLYERKENELQVYVNDKEKLGVLIRRIRLRQHEFNNHIMAILAMHYTKDTYEELVAEQKEYCNHIFKENKYNTLLSLYNGASAGFLYEKIQDIESAGIKVECHVSVSIYEPLLPEYYLIEMLGILLDNAKESLENKLEKRIHIEIFERSEGYEYIISNPYKHVSYDEICKWFEYGKSNKGSERGLGLYHLKCIAEEWNCDINCRCTEHDDLTWIEFRIITRRKGM